MMKTTLRCNIIFLSLLFSSMAAAAPAAQAPLCIEKVVAALKLPPMTGVNLTPMPQMDELYIDYIVAYQNEERMGTAKVRCFLDGKKPAEVMPSPASNPFIDEATVGSPEISKADPKAIPST